MGKFNSKNILLVGLKGTDGGKWGDALISVSDWHPSSDGYYATVFFAGVNANTKIIASPYGTHIDAAVENGVYLFDTDNGRLNFHAKTLPTQTIAFKIFYSNN